MDKLCTMPVRERLESVRLSMCRGLPAIVSHTVLPVSWRNHMNHTRFASLFPTYSACLKLASDTDPPCCYSLLRLSKPVICCCFAVCSPLAHGEVQASHWPTGRGRLDAGSVRESDSPWDVSQPAACSEFVRGRRIPHVGSWVCFIPIPGH